MRQVNNMSHRDLSLTKYKCKPSVVQSFLGLSIILLLLVAAVTEPSSVGKKLNPPKMVAKQYLGAKTAHTMR